MFYNTQEMLLAKRIEERTNLQQAIELQERRLMNLQLQDFKEHHHYRQRQSSIPSPVFSQTPNNSHTFTFPSSVTQPQIEQGN